MVQCAECDKWRLVFSKKKLTQHQRKQLAEVLEDVEYTCGFQFGMWIIFCSWLLHIKIPVLPNIFMFSVFVYPSRWCYHANRIPSMCQRPRLQWPYWKIVLLMWIWGMLHSLWGICPWHRRWWSLLSTVRRMPGESNSQEGSTLTYISYCLFVLEYYAAMFMAYSIY